MSNISLRNPKILDHYDIALSALTKALAATQVEQVLVSRDELDHIKLYARQIRDRSLLADATEFQMRVERHLGTLLRAARAAGQLRGKGWPAQACEVERIATLPEIGVDRKLSMKSQAAAGMSEETFATAVADARTRISSGGAKIISGMRSKGASDDRAVRDDRFLLSDGVLLGQVRLGKLQSRIEALALELKILTAIKHHVGSFSDALASVDDAIGNRNLSDIVRCARQASE